MLLNDDFAARAVMHSAAMDWVPSPTKGVDRRMLFRIGDEKARATSIVRYAPDSHFPRHAHPGGEEILVLDGVFQDDAGDYPAGSYVRNPPGSAHTPASQPGCTIFVHLWQFRRDDHAHVVRPAGATGVLFDNGHEQVRIEQWQGDVRLENPRGLELLVLEGGFDDGPENFTAQSWLRLPAGMALNARTAGARVWIKDGKLPQDNLCEFGTMITIYHNPQCGTSRNTLAMIRNSGQEPMVIEYLKTPPLREELKSLIARAGLKPRDVLRKKGELYESLNLADPALGDDAILDAMMAHPILIERPLVVTPLGVRLCRPSEAVLDILPGPQRAAFAKEDGEQVVDAQGRRIAKS